MQLPLFENTINTEENILPYQGKVQYFGKIYTKKEADFFYENLLNSIEWKNDEAIIFGKHIVTKRKVAWYGEKEFEYAYSNITKKALIWNNILLNIKAKVEDITDETYNSCLLNLYHNGTETMAWHSDGEKDLKENGAIASVTFGAERQFSFKHKITKEKVSLLLLHGSLLVMKEETQKFWLHRLPPTNKIKTPRINLTFRTIIT